MDIIEYDSLYYMFLQVIKVHYNASHDLLEKRGLYPGQPLLLSMLLKKEGRSQKELSEKLGIKPATVTVMLNRMEKGGVIERKQDSQDQRISRVYITEKGRKVCKDARIALKIMNEKCFEHFNLEEKIIFRRLLMQMRDNLIDFKEED